MKIFISYRRDDSAGYAGRLFDFLGARFGSKNVFMDIDTIQPGDDFRKVVKDAVGACDVVLVMIGKQWLNMTDAKGQRRLDDSRDWVRVEVATALANPDVRVIPVLLRGASMPEEHELPEGLKELSWRNALELSDSRFQHDASKLVGVIQRTTERSKATLPIERHKSNAVKYGAISLGVLVLGLVMGIALYGLRQAGTTPTSTMDVSFTFTSPPATQAILTDPPVPTWTASPPPSPTLTPEFVLGVDSATVVDVLWVYFYNINNATEKEQIIKSWNMLTTDMQNKLHDQGEQPESFINYWWQWHVFYKIYFCDLYTVIVEYRLAPRNQQSSPQETEHYERYKVIEQNGQFKINRGDPTSGVDAHCSFVLESP